MSIRVLDQKVASKIAAGEVVERPASVVKELIENSLDALSSRIVVEARDGGVSLIRVSDDGTGIPRDEVEIAFSRYATSKVNNINDLESINTFGFRGEALPSIAAVADVEITTCSDGETNGISLSLSNGGVVNKGQKAHGRGTTISISKLFQNVPARLKFLKSVNTENSHIARVVSEYALSCPDVKFSLTIDGRSVLNTSGSGKLIDAVIEVYGLDIARNMLEIGGSGNSWREDTGTEVVVAGMIGSPILNRANREYINFFVNRRSISSRLLTWAVEEAYHGLLMQGRHPVAIIKISLPPDQVDANIHPTKAEVRFRNERMVFSAVQKAVRGNLVEMAPVPRIEEPTPAFTAPPSARQLWSLPNAESIPVSGITTAPVPPATLPPLRVLGQIDRTYIVAEGPDGLYLIDQHAAHERILYEKFREQQSRQQIEVQGLLESVPFEVTPQQEEILNNCYEQLVDSGFTMEPFGERTYLVRAIPALLHQKEWAAMIREVLDNTVGEKESDWTEQFAISLACHAAVRAAQVMSDEEMRELIRQLERTTMPRTCPHGRPTVIHLSSKQLENEFHRT